MDLFAGYGEIGGDEVTILGAEFVRKVGHDELWIADVRQLMAVGEIIAYLMNGKPSLFKRVRREIFGEATCWNWGDTGKFASTQECMRMFEIWNLREARRAGL